ncbi:zinc finger BED domain-containing protein 4-like [Rhipicephalus sanguineus]|uniref:zinc finger BED domain-containing protein 4-like n=1 Tax=Rhipicephalus sanguineus TaxID=34632 RepID=UPI0020C28757|nr:zinc finger BED domain-containing protein 4-like [Rhipicephalus sanguineus]
MPNLYENAKAKLRGTLKSSSHCAITADIWTSCTTESYITVTCHFLEDTIMRSAVLSTAVFQGAHTAQNVTDVIGGVLEDWGIRQAIVAFVTDNDKRMVLAARLLGFEHLPCFAHTLNLTVQDGLKSSEELAAVLLKCKNIVRYVKSSCIATTKLREEQERVGKVPPLKLKQETPTRWNSIFYMLKRILDVGEVLTLTLSKLPRAPSPLPAEDITVIEDVVELLEPFEEATKLVSGDEYTTISLAIPVVCGIAQELEERIEPNMKTEIGKEILRECISSLHKRMDTYEERQLTSLATLLDPRLKERAFSIRTNADRAKARLIGELSQQMSEKLVGPAAESTRQQAVPNEVATGSRILRFLERKRHEPSTATSNADLMVRQYLELPPEERKSNPLKFWQSWQCSTTPLS